GAADFPFQRVAMERFGTVSTCSPIVINGKVFFVALNADGGLIAYQIDGFTPTRISTHAVETAWGIGHAAGTLSISYTYTEDGHVHWVINFSRTGNNGAWGYDLTSGQWYR